MPIILGREVSRITSIIQMNKSMNDTDVSASFLHCADKQLDVAFHQLAGFALPKYTCLNDVFVPVKYGVISYIDSYLNTGHKNQPVKICWRSHSGKIYHLHDEMDCNDVEFWLQDLDIDLLYRNLYGPAKLPFSTKAFSFEVQTGSIDQSLEMRFYPVENVVVDEAFLRIIDAEIDSTNEKSRLGKSFNGLIHNWKSEICPKYALYQIDFGSANLKLLRNLLKKLSDKNICSKVVVGRIAGG